MRTTLIACGLLAAVSTATAQSNAAAGFTYRVMTGATSRGPQGAGPAQLLCRFDVEDYRGIGNAQATSLTGNDVTGCQIIVQDQYALAGSQEQYDIRFYGEDLATPNPGFPNFAPNQPVGTNELAHLGPFTSPVGGTVADPRGAWIIATAFATPLTLPNAQDVFVGVQFQQAAAANTGANPPSWPNDGLSLHSSVGAAGIAQVYDDRGPALINAGNTASSYMLVHDPVNGVYAYSGGPHQGQVDFLVSTAAGRGVVTAITNQSTYTLSNTAPGTASFFSALHPDARSTPLHTGRADNIGYAFFGAPAGSLVFFLQDFSFTSNPLPLATFFPGSTGSQCLNLGGFQTLGFAFASGTGVDSYVLTLTPGARNLVAGVQLVFQGVEFDIANNVLRGGPCGAIKL